MVVYSLLIKQYAASAPNDFVTHLTQLYYQSREVAQRDRNWYREITKRAREILPADKDSSINWMGERKPGGYVPVQKTIPISITTVEKTSESFLFASTAGITSTAILTCRHRHCECSSLAISHASPSKVCLQRTPSPATYRTRSKLKCLKLSSLRWNFQLLSFAPLLFSRTRLQKSFRQN